MARQQSHPPGEQPRVRGRLPGKRHHLLRRAGGILQEAGALFDAGHRVGRADPGRPLDARARGLKAMLGSDWDKTYAASNTIYVTRQNNILFSLLAQFFGPDAMNDRLFLIETISFTTTPDEMLASLTRIVGDRSAGALFWGNYDLMNFELMGGNARAAII